MLLLWMVGKMDVMVQGYLNVIMVARHDTELKLDGLKPCTHNSVNPGCSQTKGRRLTKTIDALQIEIRSKLDWAEIGAEIGAESEMKGRCLSAEMGMKEGGYGAEIAAKKCLIALVQQLECRAIRNVALPANGDMYDCYLTLLRKHWIFKQFISF
ncbi:hypothetical protein Tco_0098318 [Tanacetum coccineum]